MTYESLINFTMTIATENFAFGPEMASFTIETVLEKAMKLENISDNLAPKLVRYFEELCCFGFFSKEYLQSQFTTKKKRMKINQQIESIIDMVCK